MLYGKFIKINWKGLVIMLTKCPECELQVSDKAISCPHCGYPLNTNVIQKNSRRNITKRRRLPNGFGQISEIKGRNLRKPFRAMVTIGKTSTGKPIPKLLKPQAYFATYNEAYEALVEYKKNPYDLNEDLTVKEIYDLWFPEYMQTKNKTYGRSLSAAWNYCSSIYDMRFKDLRSRHIKGCMEKGTFEFKGENRKPSPTTQSRIKSLFNLMGDYALEHEIVTVNYARSFKLSEKITDAIEDERTPHISYTVNEMCELWNNSDVPYVDTLLIQCYSGWRPQELLNLKIENVDLTNWIFTGGMKTKAGINRPVPIHTKIRPLVQRLYDEAKCIGSEYLVNCREPAYLKKDYVMTYDKYKTRFKNIIKALNLNPDHRPHDGREHFVTQAKLYHVDEYAIKYIVGHSINDITEKIYTERSMDWLKEEIEKIK